uniref:Uncharacterized protein n=1 Tax=Sphaerodactylus townsendi TaxID=933632 RepID=A0ACB8FX93_9SAUR
MMAMEMKLREIKAEATEAMKQAAFLEKREEIVKKQAHLKVCSARQAPAEWWDRLSGRESAKENPELPGLACLDQHLTQREVVNKLPFPLKKRTGRATDISQKVEEIGFQEHNNYLFPPGFGAERCDFDMYRAAGACDDFDDNILTQYVIQQSLQDVHKCETVTTAENDRFYFATSANHRKIITAIRTGEEETLLLISHSSAFQEQDGDGCLPLHDAAAQLNKHILEITLKASDPTVWQQTNVKGETPLFVAVDKCLVENVHFLLLNVFNPGFKNEDGDSPLFIAVQHDSYEIASLLLQFAKVNLQYVNKRTALHEAAKLGRKSMVEFLLWSKADPDPWSSYGFTPLAQNGHTEILEILLRRGTDDLSQASDCASILFEAAGGGNPDSVSLLLEYGADANVPKHSGHLPIHRASYRGHLLVLQILVPVMDYSAIKENGISPVHSVAAGGHFQCLEFLLKSGFDPNFMLHQRVPVL